MSDNWLFFVPADPGWRPRQDDAELALGFLRNVLLSADEFAAHYYEKPTLVHPFANWSGVSCPSCGADAEEAWYEGLEKLDSMCALDELNIVVGCCGVRTSLNDFAFGWPTAFGRFALEIMNPARDTSPTEERDLSGILGCDLRKVWRHL
jgi:hypothetical protein